jgi:deoxyribose-phosphate aldolase
LHCDFQAAKIPMTKPAIELSKKLEHTLLGSNLDEKKVVAHILEAQELGVFGICLPLAWVSLAKKTLSSPDIKIITVVDFPLGQQSPAKKAEEAALAQLFGADEIDMVIDYQAIISKNYQCALDGILAVKEQIHDKILKVIVETSALDQEQLICAITIVGLSGAHFIKTSTGFHKSGANIKDIALMHKLLPTNIQIKAAGGIKTRLQAMQMLEAGAARVGSSQSYNILQGKN